MVIDVDLTAILADWNNGDPTALDRLIPLVYRELHEIANQYLGRKGPSHTIQPTELINELCIKFLNRKQTNWTDRNHFFATASTLMRRILIDYVRRYNAEKRPNRQLGVSLSQIINSSLPQVLQLPTNLDLIALDRVLDKLQEVAPDKSRLVELRFFLGLEIEEIATIQECSAATIKRALAFARAWLYREINKEVNDKQ
ncbi:MAG: ECF-type sigma factor [Acidobacteriota bacterium]